MNHHLSEIIRWKVPTARVSIRGSGDDAKIIRWNGPGRQPSASQLAQWAIDYHAQGIEQEQAALDQLNRSVAVQALIAEVASQLGLSEDEFRGAVKDRVKSILQDGS
jgi:hypothetical protein